VVSFEKIDYTTDQFVELYDELPLWSAPFGLLLLEHVPLQSARRIPDVGAGTGFLSVELAQRSMTCVVVAVDPWSAALRRLKSKAERLGLANICAIESSIEDVDLEPESFDLVVSNLGINNFSEPLAAIRKCSQVLKKGGHFVLCTNTRGHMAEFYNAYCVVLQHLGLVQERMSLERHIDHRVDETSLSMLLESGGFAVTNIYRDSFSMRFAGGTALFRHHLIRSAFLPSWAEICPPDQRVKVFTALEQRFNVLAQAQGDLSLSVPMLCVQAINRT